MCERKTQCSAWCRIWILMWERVKLGKGANVFISRSAQGICPPQRGSTNGWPGGWTIRDKIDSKERKVENSKRIKHTTWAQHTTWAHEDDAWDVVHTPNLRLHPRMCVSINEKMWRVKCAVHTPSVAADCYHLYYNFNQKFVSVTPEQLNEEAARRVTQFFLPLFHKLRGAWLFEINELHQESFHCHQDVLDEDDGCHSWNCQNRIRASRSSPDSWWRRCNFVNASLSFIGLLRPDVLREIHQFFLYLNYSSDDMRWVKSFCASLSIRMHTSSVRSILSCESRNVQSFWKRSWIHTKFFLMHLFLRLWAMKCFICSSVFPWRLPWCRTFLMT